MSEPTNVTVVVPEPVNEETPQKTPFYKNPRVLKTAGIVAATAAATAIVVSKVRGSGNAEDSENESDTTDIVIED